MHIRELSSLRGIAAVVVVLGHAFNIIDWRAVTGSPLNNEIYDFIGKTFNGPAAVELFFVLSGLVLSLSLEGRNDGSFRWIQDFYVKRAFRIYPALWISVILSLVLLPLARNACAPGLCTHWANGAFQDNFTPEKVILSFAGIYVHLNAPLWSLRVELLYSLLFPLIYLSLRHKKTQSIAFVAVFALALLPIPRVYSVHYALAFFLGSAIPLIPFQREILPFKTFTILSCAILIFSRQILTPFNLGEKTFEIIEIWASFIIIYLIFHKKIRPAVLRGKVLYYVGEISYSIYVLHFPILFAVFYLLEDTVGISAIKDSPGLYTALLGLIALAITICASILNFHFVEVPFQTLGKNASKRHNEN